MEGVVGQMVQMVQIVLMVHLCLCYQQRNFSENLIDFLITNCSAFDLNLGIVVLGLGLLLANYYPFFRFRCLNSVL